MGQTVVIPFEIPDRIGRQQRIQVLKQVIHHRRQTQIQLQLATAGDTGITRRRQHPFGVGAIQVAVWIDHFRLDPKTKFLAGQIQRLDQGRETLGPDLG